jgi:uncharacterized repeat protein (TIGR03837 family)
LTRKPTSVDIFCRVVDNYGDIGVTWRLARQLVDEYGFDVRLFVDDLASVEKIVGGGQYRKFVDGSAIPSIIHWKSAPDGEFGSEESFSKPPKPVRGTRGGVSDCMQSAAERRKHMQVLSLVEPHSLHQNQLLTKQPFDKLRANGGLSESLNVTQPADIVIEAFACELPAPYIHNMAARAAKPIWLNLEYLSAEPWVAEHHLLPSPHPRLDLTKHFFFPGFTDKTGGLIREKSIQATPFSATPAPTKIFAFGYDSPHSRALLSVIANTECIANITIAEGALADASKHLPKCRVTPFVPQPDFDRVLAAHDFCWVRGEDSFVRAQYAGKPFIWQIYPQDDGAHLVKLQAFLDLYCAGMSRECADAVRALNVWLSDESVPASKAPWQNALTHWQEWQQHAHHWQKTLLAQTDLATKLVSFYQKSLII